MRILFEEGVRGNASVERHAAGTDDPVQNFFAICDPGNARPARLQSLSVRMIEIVQIVSPHKNPLDFHLIPQVEIDAFLTGQHFPDLVDTG